MVSGSPKLSLRGLRTFSIAARYGSFQTASEVLSVTASAVSHQIKSLEQELGVELFDRGSTLKLTPTGQALYEDIGPLIEQLDAVAGSYKKGAVRSSVKISVQPFFASEFFMPRLREFTNMHPEIDIQVGASDETSETHPSDSDLSIRLFRTPPAGLQSRLLFPLRLLPAGSKKFAKAMKVKGKKIVSDFPIIIHETYPKAWKQWAKASGIELPKDGKVTRLDTMIAVVRAVEQDIGAALVPIPLADLWFKQGSIVRLFDKELVANVSYYLVWKEDRTGSPAVVLLRDWILENLSETA
jgi:LysR family glycine cleavage system transcriptional activator